MENLLSFSGIVVAAIAWIFLIYPFFTTRKKIDVTTISDVAEYKNSITIGILLSVIFQVLYASYFYLTTKSLVSKFGIVLFLLSSFSFAAASFVKSFRNRDLHARLIKTYYFLMSFGFLLIGVELFKNLVFNLIIPVMWIGSIYLYQKKEYWKTEVWIVTFLSVWATIVFLINSNY